MIHKRIVQETVKIKTLFDNCGVPNVPKAITIIPFGLNVKTPYGFKRIDHIFRTPIEETVTTYFTNNKTLKTSPQHRVKVDNNWKYVSELTETDIIETEQGFTRLRSQKYHKPESLYDIAVDDVHCYYSNGILSHNSWFLAKLGTNALKSGKTVLHYTLELADIYTAKRYDSLLCGIPFNDLKYHQETIQNTVSKLKGKLFIKEFPPATLSLTALEAHIEKFILSGVKPDLLIIDYPELLKINYTGERDDKVLGQLYTDIRGLSGRFDMATWIVDQTNRCLKFDSKVEIESKGIINIEDVKVGDKISTQQGFKEVKHVFDPEIQPVYRIKLKNGKTIECSAKHEFPTAYGKMKSLVTGLKVGDKLFVKK